MSLFPFSFLKSAASPSSFSPADLAQLLGWLDGGNQATLHSDGGNNFTGWDDSSPNGFNGAPSDLGLPQILPSGLQAKNLIKLFSDKTFQSVKDPLPFGSGWDYAGPMICAMVFTAKLAEGDSNRILTIDGTSLLTSIGANSGYRSLNGFPGNGSVPEISTDLTGLAYGFLSSAWPGRIVATLSSTITVVILNFYDGMGGGFARAFFIAPAEGSIPAYFSSMEVIPFVHSLASNGARKFFWGYGAATADLFQAEYYVAIDDPAGQSFTAQRDYLLGKWIGAIRPIQIVHGDSLAGGFGIGQALAWPYRFALQATSYDVLNCGINSRTLLALADDQPAYINSLPRPGTGKNHVIIDAGTNDIAGGASAATTLSRLLTLTALWKANGFFVTVLDIIPRNYGAPLAGNPQDAAKEAQRISYNLSLATLSDPSIDRIVFQTSLAPFNDVNAWSNLTYYDPDQVHLTALGYQTKADNIYAMMFP